MGSNRSKGSKSLEPAECYGLDSMRVRQFLDRGVDIAAPVRADQEPSRIGAGVIGDAFDRQAGRGDD